MGMTPDIDDVKEAYINKRVGELMTPSSKLDDVEGIAEDEFEDFIATVREEALKEFKLNPRGNVIIDD